MFSIIPWVCTEALGNRPVRNTFKSMFYWQMPAFNYLWFNLLTVHQSSKVTEKIFSITFLKDSLKIIKYMTICIRGKHMLDSTTFKNAIFYGVWNFRPFLRCYAAGKKRAGFSNPVKNRVLESCSKIFWPLVPNIFVLSK